MSADPGGDDARAAGTPRITIRAAVAVDIGPIAAIYNEGIRGRGATFETAERSPDEIADWLAPIAAIPYPLLVATAGDGVVLGWARASSYRPRACYARIGEISIYVAGAARGQRIGDTLMAALIDASARAGLTKLVSRVFPENVASRAMCARHGFREVGVYERHAQLDGEWRDVVIVERLLSSVSRIAPIPDATDGSDLVIRGLAPTPEASRSPRG